MNDRIGRTGHYEELSGQGTFELKYRADVDGLRAVAVVAVVMYHARLGFTGGYVGVDVFFVISGFLITTILKRKLKNGSFSLIDFWARRVKRLVPALFTMTVFTAATAYFLLIPDHLFDLGGALIAQPLLMVNIYFSQVVTHGYFGDPPEIRPLLHTWSLGVEEQFYIFLPLFLVLCWGSRFLRSRLAKIVLMIALGSLSLGVISTPNHGPAAFFNLPTRAWELLAGSLLAFAPDIPQRYREGFAWVGLALITYAVFFYNQYTPFPGTAALVPCIGSALLIWSSDAERMTIPAKFLSHRSMVLVGLASYSIYLWHWPLFAFGNYIGILVSKESKVVAIVLSFVLGFLSWRYIERPFRGDKYLKTYWHVAFLVTAYIGVCGSVGYWYYTSEGLPENWSSESLEYVKNEGRRTYLYGYDPGSDDTPPRWLGAEGEGDQVDFILWGDSHAMSLSALVDSLGKKYGQRGIQLTQVGIRNPLGLRNDDILKQEMRDRRELWKQEILDVADRLSPKYVIICGHWRVYREKELLKDLEESIGELEKRGVKVIIVLDNPMVNDVPMWSNALKARWSVLESIIGEPKLELQAEHDRINRTFNTFIKKSTWRWVDLAPSVYQWTGPIFGSEGLYFDANHLSDYGVNQLGHLFEPFFDEMAGGVDSSLRHHDGLDVDEFTDAKR